MNRRAQGDEGSALLIAMAFFIAFTLLTVAMLEITATSLHEAGLVHAQRSSVYAAESAIQTEVRLARDSFISYVNGGQVGTWSCPQLSTTTFNAIAASVTCAAGVTMTADFGPKPSDAIRTIGGGVTVNKGAGTPKTPPGVNNCAGGAPGNIVQSRVLGNVVSGGSIQIGDPCVQLVAQGSISAFGPCTGRGTYSPSPSCKTGVAVTDNLSATVGAAVATLAAGLPNINSLPSCSSSPVVFTPGVYGTNPATNGAALSAMFNGNKANPCTGKVFEFPAGVYKFAFTGGGGANEWKINDPAASVIAGVPSTFTGKPSIPGGCQFSGAAAGSAGTTFVFSGASRLHIQKGQFELCPPPPVGGQRIGIAGDSTESGNLLTVEDKAAVSIRGTVYAPKGNVDLHNGRSSTPMLTRGLIARSVKIQSNVFNVPVITLPVGASQAQTDATLHLSGMIGTFDTIDATVIVHHDASAPAASQVTITTADWQDHA